VRKFGVGVTRNFIPRGLHDGAAGGSAGNRLLYDGLAGGAGPAAGEEGLRGEALEKFGEVRAEVFCCTSRVESRNLARRGRKRTGRRSQGEGLPVN